jgi:hypothetical protein
MMAENASSAGSRASAFSEMDELPPLKEVYVAPPPVHKPEPRKGRTATIDPILRRSEPEKRRFSRA